VTSSMCPHVEPAAIEEDRQNLKSNVFAIKHDAQFLFDAGDSMISLEHVRPCSMDHHRIPQAALLLSAISQAQGTNPSWPSPTGTRPTSSMPGDPAIPCIRSASLSPISGA
jgi:hypothetical protein